MESVHYGGAYLMHGPEKYGMEQKRAQLEKRYIDPAMRDLNYDVAREDAGEILAKANTLPFMSEKRMVVVRDAGLLSSDADLDTFLEDVFSVPDSTILLLMETETPIKKNQKLYKRFKKAGRLIAMERLQGRALRSYLANYLAKLNRRITPEALEHFIRLSGYSDRNYSGDLEALVTTLDQIASISKEEVRVEAIDTFLDPFQTETIFDLLDAIAKKRAEDVLRLLNEFDVKEEPAPRILYMIARQTRNLLFYKTMKRTGRADSEIFRFMGVKPFEGKKIAAQSGLYTERALRGQYDMILEAELAMKSTSASDAEVLETLTLKMLRGQ
ncbi:MAG: DNA polymerase III subunit delta [Peptoniphilus sp.]|nr:DNA polymerase III subunit delta [Peptoniphilus sp.]MDD7362762.1 DNA polymerase III subunit delta [Bacillota bacterium]MDY6044544.1 DNA polymerase III subunit delta [Peptoniphilus sp.]